MTYLPDENSKRFIAILNKKIETGRLMNALGHMTTSLVGSFEDKKELCLVKYEDKEGGFHGNISHYPFIVLKADNSNKIRKIREECLIRDIAFTDFTSTMTIGTTTDQQQATAKSEEKDLEYFGIVMFGDTQGLKEFTGKFSLFQ